ncbi:glycosyltransferase [Clostridium mediterraneense]|uniref:glycosyltransferase n=1 Tax=Clostridium mediterraneense TaxID=1805472 RepID=UPI00082AA275|nr:glycosyltransferase [Clostridium mediterraneense]
MDRKVSVILSFYNEDIMLLKQSIESILKQTFNDLELIIISDNPKNYKCIKYVEEVKKIDSRIIFIQNHTNKGLVYCLNKGIEISSGKYIVRMDADDISYKNRIEEQVNYMEDNNYIDLLGSEVDLIDEDGNFIKSNIINRSKKEVNIMKILSYGNLFIHPSIIFRRKLIDEIGGYRDVKYAEDYDLILRCISNNKRIRILNKRLLKYRVRKSGVSRSNTDKQMISTCYINELYKNKKMEEFTNEENEQRINKNLSIVDKIKINKNKIIFIILSKVLN